VTERKRLKLDGQAMRLLRWLRENNGASSLEVTQALSIVNVTGRVSDLRSAGYVIECRKGPDRRDRYFIREARPEPLTGTQLGAFG
jgi:hypothetical protein